MTVSTIISMLIGVVIPLLITVITKDALGQPWKQLILLLLTTTTGVLTSITGSLPSTLSGWEHALLNIVMTYISAAVAYLANWKESNTRQAIQRATANIGIGPKHVPEHAQHHGG